MDLFGGTGGLVVIAIVIASLGRIMTRTAYKIWLTKYVRPLDDDEYRRVREINQPSPEDNDGNGTNLLKKLGS